MPGRALSDSRAANVAAAPQSASRGPNPRAAYAAERADAVERRIAWTRLAALLFGTFAYAFLLEPRTTIPWLGWATLAIGWLYAPYSVFFRSDRPSSHSLSGIVASALDGVLILLWITATGGFESEFHVIIYGSVIAVAFQYGYREAVIAALVYAAAYLLLLAALGELAGNFGPAVIRAGFVFLIGPLGALLAREAIEQGGEKLELRELKRAADAARASAEDSLSLLRATLESTADGILVVDTAGQIVEHNQRFLDLWQLPGEIADARDDRRAIAYVLDQLRDPDAFHARIREIYAAPRSESFDVLELRDGRQFERYSRPQWMGDRIAGRVWSFRDVTAQKRLEAELAQSRKLEAIGRLADGVAHQVNNPLTYAILNLQSLEEEMALRARGKGNGVDWEGALRQTREAREGCERVGEIVRSLRTLRREEPVGDGPIDVHTAIDQALEATAEAIRPRARVVKTFGDVPPLRIRAEALSTVLVNLLRNAWQSIDEGDAEKNEIRVRTRFEGGEVVVEIEDTGCGMAREHVHKIFDPFFTTRELGEGTGLGLSVSLNLVREVGGRIDVETVPGRGSRFTVRIPIEPPRSAFREKGPVAAGDAAGRILIVDDEAPVRSAVASALAHEYAVVEASGGREALALLSRDRAFDLILCDLMMPDLSGMALCESLEKIAPDLCRRIVFMTGGAFTPRAERFLERIPNRCIEKPFRGDALLEMVRTATAPRTARTEG